MRLDLRYWGHSEVRESGSGLAVSFAPNLARPKVYFDGQVLHPLRFREAMSALHDVVVGDLRFKKKDKSAYQAWKQDQLRLEAQIRSLAFNQAKKAELEALAREPVPPGLEQSFHKMHGIYWTARRKWATDLQRNDPELFRHLVPCDPVVTVAPDVVYFECFSKDESSYGCLLVDRDAFRGESASAPGTTNVDYSLALYDHFQTLRTYRPTRLLVDPAGFEVKVTGHADYREEKIDLPPSWLRGFGQIQAAMTLPTKRVEISRDALYSVLAFLRRHREKTGPRSLRFVLKPGEPPTLILDPWGTIIPSRGAPYQGEGPLEIKVWGRRRLMTMARVLPLAEKIEVALLGSGLPSIWIAHLGEMRFVLALSGWTTNDWTSGAALELMAATYRPEPQVVDALARFLHEHQKATLRTLTEVTNAAPDVVLGSLHRLAKQGQVIYDFAGSVYRYRSVMPVALSEAVIGPDHPELVNGQRLHRENRVKIVADEMITANRRMIKARVDTTECEGLIDADGAYARAKCECSYFFKNRLRGGPCRHLLAVQLHLRGTAEPPPATRLFH